MVDKPIILKYAPITDIIKADDNVNKNENIKIYTLFT